MSADRLEQIKAKERIGGEDIGWLIAEVDRYREALRQITDYDVEAHHGPVGEWAEAEAFAAVSEIAAAALYFWEKKAKQEHRSRILPPGGAEPGPGGR